MIKDGIINLLKPAGMTSHDGVSMLRRLTGIKRIGHTGTLDPCAVGVLPLCIGSAARINEYLDLDEKRYRCEMQLGIETDTQDIWGTVTASRLTEAMAVTFEQIQFELSRFKGYIRQTPPKYSALRVDGKRLYEYARAGESVEIKSRPVVISDIKLLSYHQESRRAVIEVVCSKGTYIRTICQDLGEALGCGATMSFLLRLQSGAFHLGNSVTIEELQRWADSTASGKLEEETANEYRIPTEYPLQYFGSLLLAEGREKWFLNGGYLIDKDVNVLKRPFEDYEMNKIERRIEYLGIRQNYYHAYKVYAEKTFLGVVFYEPQAKRYVADKVFYK